MDALLVVDVQKAMFTSGAEPYQGRAVVARIAALIGAARRAATPVFHVQHDGGPGDDFCRDLAGFAICDEVAPAPGEHVFIKTTRSAFASTDLEARLRKAGVNRLALCGMQTEYCIDTTLLGAVDRGFRMTVVRDGHTTFDNDVLPAEKIIALHHRIWQGVMAELVPADRIEFGARS